MTNYKEKIENGLNISIDYVAFTILEQLSVVEVIRFMGFDEEEFYDMPKGSNGYKKQLKNHNTGISVLYDGQDNMGIHVNVTGKGVTSLLESFAKSHSLKNPFNNSEIISPFERSVLSIFCQEVLEVGKFTRLDIAIDDIGGNYYTPDEVFNYYLDDKIISKWRNVEPRSSYSSPNIRTSSGLYFGSRESALMLRIYDKKLEQNRKKTPTDDEYIDYEWIRWELEFKSDRANQLAEQLIDNTPLSCVAIGVLSYYFRIIQLDNNVRCRCSNDEQWDRFIHNIEKLRLHFITVEKNIYDKANWVEEQVAPTLAVLLLLACGQTDILNNIALRNISRISKHDKNLIKALNPDIYEQYFEDFELES